MSSPEDTYSRLAEKMTNVVKTLTPIKDEADSIALSSILKEMDDINAKCLEILELQKQRIIKQNALLQKMKEFEERLDAVLTLDK